MLLHHRVAPLDDFDPVSLVHLRPDITRFAGQPGQGVQGVQPGQLFGEAVQRRRLLQDPFAQSGQEFRLQGQDPFLGVQQAFLEFLELRGDEAFGVDQGLLAQVILGHQVQIGFAYLQVIAEDPVVADLEGIDAGTLDFLGLEAAQALPAVTLQVPQPVQFRVVAAPDQAPL
ncbi:MAG: hypothetical protein BWY73_01116 [candidate division TA06 bacterium ADurb.Bin417]|uniref:Uncharacterized protein n=1 Tax=candidate division TA06 bacterium ADurb.Bin417 TaxID=1852828 RepID=A0A1V5MDR7_UNCT6|nr:MAG: hypothetical protein BWY73_01116 [candidate division TA06 bacterium ADurb.Bin417]